MEKQMQIQPRAVTAGPFDRPGQALRLRRSHDTRAASLRMTIFGGVNCNCKCRSRSLRDDNKKNQGNCNCNCNCKCRSLRDDNKKNQGNYNCNCNDKYKGRSRSLRDDNKKSQCHDGVKAEGIFMATFRATFIVFMSGERWRGGWGLPCLEGGRRTRSSDLRPGE